MPQSGRSIGLRTVVYRLTGSLLSDGAARCAPPLSRRHSEPAHKSPRKCTRLGASELRRKIGQGDVFLRNERLGKLLAHIVHEFAKSCILIGKSSLQCPARQPQAFSDVFKFWLACRQNFNDFGAHQVRYAQRWRLLRCNEAHGLTHQCL